MRPADTSPEVHALQLARMRAMSSSDRAELGERLCRSARAVMRAGIRDRHPDYGEREVELAMWRLLVEDTELLRAAVPEALTIDP
jgi:hypothetical protein